MSRDFDELYRLAGVGTIFVTSLLALYLIILAFARDKIVRPRLFSWGAILFGVSIVIPILSLTIVSLTRAYSQGGGRGTTYSSARAGSLGDMFELLAMIVSQGAMIVAPLLLAISILFAIIGLTPKFEYVSAHYSPSPQNAPPQRTPVQNTPSQPSQNAPSQKAPHPLD